MIAKIGNNDGKASESLSENPSSNKKDAPDLAEKKQKFEEHIQKKPKKNKKQRTKTTSKKKHEVKKSALEKNTTPTLIDIPKTMQFTEYLGQKTPQMTQAISKIVHETPLTHTSATALKKNYIDNQVKQLEKPGSVCTTSNHIIQHQVDGTLHWRITNGPLQGLEITAQVMGSALHIGIKAADKKQKDTFLKNKDKIETLAQQKRGGKPVKLEIIDGKY